MRIIALLKEKLGYLLRPHRVAAIGAHRGLILARRFSIGAAMLSLFIYWLHPTLLERLDIRVRDIAFQIREAPPPPAEVVVVAVDEKSVKLHGRWPWPRATQGALIERLKVLGARVIALDIIYGLPQDRKNDRALAAALDAPGAPVIGGYFFRDEQSIRTDEASIAAVRKNSISTLLEKAEARYDTVAVYPFVEANHPALAPHFSAFGYFNTIPDHDGLIRSSPLVLRYGGEYYPSLALQALAIGQQQSLALDIDREGIAAIRLGGQKIPVNAQGRLALNFYSNARPIPLLSAADVLDGTIAPERIRNKLVFIGATEIGIADVRPTPIDHSFPGVAIHATVAANIIQGFHLYHDNRTVLLDVLLMALLPMLMVWLMSKLERPVFMTIVFVATIALIWTIFYLAVSVYGLLISFFYPMIAVMLGYTIFEMYEILVTQRRNRYIRRAFSSYVSPTVVKTLLQKPDELNLHGEKRYVTILFSDIRGFTTISESMPPEMLGRLLNNYLGEMTEILMNESGTLDKYIGDAVMGIFNAPLDHPDHPLLAATTAIKMQTALRELNRTYQEEYNVNLRIGIGVHSGEAIIGNFGSPRRFNYTAMGDTVNLASRLEGQTKTYGVEIIISETTREALGDKFAVRKLDKIRVKGKSQPVEIFHLFTEGGTEDNLVLAELFDQAMDRYYAGDFPQALTLFRTIAEKYPDDKPTPLFMERCEYSIAHPPTAWDGVHTATSK